MEIKINILKPFFENPNQEFYIRELARLLKINHTTIRQYLNLLVKEGYLKVKDKKPFPVFTSVVSKKYLNLKLYYNLEKLRESGIIEDIEKIFEYPVIILFGSYANASDDILSDIDICVISNNEKEIESSKYEKQLNRKISLHLFTKRKFREMIKKNPEFINSLCNGIVISGQLEVLEWDLKKA